MKFLFLFCIFLGFNFSVVSSASSLRADRACVRDFSNGNNPCESERIFAWFPVADTNNREFCVMATTDDRCHDGLDGFFFVDTLDGEKICIQDFAQHGQEGSPCSDDISFFKWFYFEDDAK